MVPPQGTKKRWNASTGLQVKCMQAAYLMDSGRVDASFCPLPCFEATFAEHEAMRRAARMQAHKGLEHSLVIP
eukprot:885213-Pelagomonas_calceolata.AAC.4